MYWYSPIPINNNLSDKLKSLNIKQIKNINDPSDLILLIYNPPDFVIDYYFKERIDDNLSEDFLIDYYKNINNKSHFDNLKLIAGWNIENLNNEDLLNIFNNKYKSKDLNISFPKIDNKISLITLEILRSQSKIVDFYNDIELKAVICNRDIDLNILFRIKNNLSNCDSLIKEFFNIFVDMKVQTNNFNKLMDLNRDLEKKLINYDKELSYLIEKKDLISNELNNLKAYNQKLEDDLEIFYDKNKNLEKLSNKQDILIKKASSVLTSITQKNLKKLIKINDVVHDISDNSEKSRLPFFKKIKGILVGS